MKTSKYLALLAILSLGLSGLAIAQQLGEGYYGQQANPPAAAKAPAVNPVRTLGTYDLATAPQLGEGYYGQQAAPPAAAKAQAVSTCLLAQLHGPDDDAVASKLPACCFDGAHQKSAEKRADKGKCVVTSTEQEGDPDAPQNHVEYGGGGM